MKLKYILIVIGVVFCALAVYQNNESKASKLWEVADATIIISTVTHTLPLSAHDTIFYFPFIEYRYSVNNRSHVGDMFQIGQLHYSEPRPAKNLVARYPRGSQITIYYNPDNPDESVINNQENVSGIWMLGFAGAIFVMLGIWIDKELSWVVDKIMPHHVHKYILRKSRDRRSIGLDSSDPET